MTSSTKSGVTLLEILITLIVSAILTAIAIPSFQILMEKNRVKSLGNTFVTSFSYARSEAIKRGSYVTLCASEDGATCDGDLTWGDGWIVFADPNKNQVVDAGETILQVENTVKGTTTLEWNSTSLKSHVTYQPAGSVNISGGTVTLCSGEQGLNLILIRGGRMRTEKITCP